MDNGKFYRINIKFLEPNRLSPAFKSRFKNELDNNAIYLGIRFNPTNFNRSAAINSLELAHQCMRLAKDFLLDDYGKIDCQVREFPCATEFMKSIIDTDTRTLLNYTQDETFTSKMNTTLRESLVLVKNARNAFSG